MMNNLFSSFDPSTSPYNLWLNWLSILIIFLIIPSKFWVIPSKYLMIILYLFKYMNKETTVLMNKKSNLNTLIYSTLFFMLIINNFIGLFPYIFTGSSHMVMNLSIALILWTGIMLFNITNNFNHLMAHLVPLGTPSQLMSFMVIIESISSIIRPIALSVRLTANMIAGHLLLTLIGSSSLKSPSSIILFILLAQMLLVILEMAVSMIQAYVFSVLTILYASEI